MDTNYYLGFEGKEPHVPSKTAQCFFCGKKLWISRNQYDDATTCKIVCRPCFDLVRVSDDIKIKWKPSSKSDKVIDIVTLKATGEKV